MRLLATLVFLALALLMLAGSISEGMKQRHTAPHIEFRPEPKRAPLERVRRALACEPPLAAWEVETCT